MNGDNARIALVLACGVMGFGFGAAGCQQQREHPPALPACDGGPGCSQSSPIGSGGVTGVDRVTVDVPPDQRTNVTGDVMRIDSVDFDVQNLFGEPAEIRADGAGGVEVITQSDGINPFELQDVAVSPQVWFSIFPANPASVDAMPTIEPFDTRAGGAVELHVIAGSVFDLIYNVITNPTERAPGAAQIVLRFFKADNPTRPLSGVTVVAQTAEAVIYDAAGTYSDVTGATGPQGLAIIANVPAATVSRDIKIAITNPVSTTYDVRVLANAVTYGKAELTF